MLELNLKTVNFHVLLLHQLFLLLNLLIRFANLGHHFVFNHLTHSLLLLAIIRLFFGLTFEDSLKFFLLLQLKLEL